MKKYYRDFYGCTASITLRRDRTAYLRISTAGGKSIQRKQYSCFRSARVALGRFGDCWKLIAERG